jgi:lambda family phage tail tape measure protein
MAGALIGALRVSLSAETSAFEAGMKRSQRTAKQTANSIVSDFKNAGGAMSALKAGVAGFVASLSVGTILAAGRAALEYAGSLGEVSAQLGVTTKDLQTLRYAAGQTGISQEELETGLSKLAVTLGKVAAGAKAPTAALNAIGISVDQLKGKDTGEALRIIADGLAKVEDRSQRAAVEVALFGRSGAKLDTLLAGGSRQINELSAAAERLGIVLSDEQIQRADDTADKLDALKTVLAARIAGEVADNADSILKLADSLFELVNMAARASAAWVDFTNNLARKWSLPAQFNRLVKGEVFGFNTPGQTVTVPLGQVRRQPTPRVRSGGGSISQFLAGGGGGGRSRRGGRDRSAEEAERKRLEALRDANRFDQEIRRAKIDVLNSERQLAEDYVIRRNISIQILAAERAAYEADLRYQVAAGEMSQVQADQLRVERDKLDALEVTALNAEEEKERRAEVARLADIDYETAREKLELEAGLAETASEQRDVQLRLLDLYYRHERAKLNTIMAENAVGSAAWEEARRRLAGLNATQAARQANVVAGTRGPLEDYMSQLPSTTEKWNEALENVAANGLRAVEDGIVDILTGAKSVGEALQDILADIISQLIRIGVQKAIVSVIGGGFAGGGYTGVGGKYEPAGIVHRGEYVFDSSSTKQLGVPFLEALRTGKMPGMAMGGYARGLSIPRTSYNERVSVSNDNARMRGGDTYQFSFPGVRDAREARVAGIQAANAMRSAVARSSKVNG